MRRFLPAALVAMDFGFAAWAYGRLPVVVSPRWDLWVPWPPANAEPLPRAVAAFALPIGALAIWLLLTGLASSAGERLGRRVFPTWLLSDRTGADAIERFAPTFRTITAAVVAFIVLVHVGTVATMLDWPSWTVRACLAAIGLVILVVGNITPRTRPNWIAGLRTKRAMRDADLWNTVHRRFGAFLVVTGFAVIATAIFATPYAGLTGVVGVLASAILASVTPGAGGKGSSASGRSMPPVAT
jgi:SdpI/YhfL family protein